MGILSLNKYIITSYDKQISIKLKRLHNFLAETNNIKLIFNLPFLYLRISKYKNRLPMGCVNKIIHYSKKFQMLNPSYNIDQFRLNNRLLILDKIVKPTS